VSLSFCVNTCCGGEFTSFLFTNTIGEKPREKSPEFKT
jgi:hypothetical protein